MSKKDVVCAAATAYIAATPPQLCSDCEEVGLFVDVTHMCLNSDGDAYHTCEQHAKTGGWDGDAGPWPMAGSAERIALIEALSVLNMC